MKVLKNLFYWVVLPGIFAASIALSDHQLALGGAVLMWASTLVFGPLVTITLAVLTVKPGDPKWETNRAAVMDEKPGAVRRFISWAALLATVMLCSYAGFVVTAAFYLIGNLWCRMVYALLVKHFENAEAVK